MMIHMLKCGVWLKEGIPHLKVYVTITPHKALLYCMMSLIDGRIFPLIMGTCYTKDEYVYPRTMTQGAKFFMSVMIVLVQGTQVYVRRIHMFEGIFIGLACIKTLKNMFYIAKNVKLTKPNDSKWVGFYNHWRSQKVSGKVSPWTLLLDFPLLIVVMMPSG